MNKSIYSLMLVSLFSVITAQESSHKEDYLSKLPMTKTVKCIFTSLENSLPNELASHKYVNKYLNNMKERIDNEVEEGTYFEGILNKILDGCQDIDDMVKKQGEEAHNIFIHNLLEKFKKCVTQESKDNSFYDYLQSHIESEKDIDKLQVLLRVSYDFFRNTLDNK